MSKTFRDKEIWNWKKGGKKPYWASYETINYEKFMAEIKLKKMKKNKMKKNKWIKIEDFDGV